MRIAFLFASTLSLAAIACGGEEPLSETEDPVSGQASPGNVTVTPAGPIWLDCASGFTSCASNEFCSKTSCGSPATCERKPRNCQITVSFPPPWPAFDVHGIATGYRPVCGCDGETYDSECVANKHGVSVASEGYCPSDACTRNRDCAGDEYCRKLSPCQQEGYCHKVGGQVGNVIFQSLAPTQTCIITTRP